ncbi:MAG: hypothetical protein ACRCYU_14025 [Nocardioides sp.]
MTEYDELAARMRAADPAGALPPVGADRLDALLEETMTEDHSHTGINHADSARGAWRVRWLSVGVAAAALVVGGLVLREFLTADAARQTATAGDPSNERATGSPGASDVSPSSPTVTQLTLGDDALDKCRVPDVEVLRSQSLAVDATVGAIDGRRVTLNVAKWFRGEPTDQLVLRTATSELRLALSGVDFEQGGRYLVSAIDGQVTMCGFSAEYNRELARLYRQAFSD